MAPASLLATEMLGAAGSLSPRAPGGNGAAWGHTVPCSVLDNKLHLQCVHWEFAR